MYLCFGWTWLFRLLKKATLCYIHTLKLLLKVLIWDVWLPCLFEKVSIGTSASAVRCIGAYSWMHLTYTFDVYLAFGIYIWYVFSWCSDASVCCEHFGVWSVMFSSGLHSRCCGCSFMRICVLNLFAIQDIQCCSQEFQRLIDRFSLYCSLSVATLCLGLCTIHLIDLSLIWRWPTYWYSEDYHFQWIIWLWTLTLDRCKPIVMDSSGIASRKWGIFYFYVKIRHGWTFGPLNWQASGYISIWALTFELEMYDNSILGYILIWSWHLDLNWVWQDNNSSI